MKIVTLKAYVSWRINAAVIKLQAGQRRAEQRHKFMEQFLEEFYEEWDGKA